MSNCYSCHCNHVASCVTWLLSYNFSPQLTKVTFSVSLNTYEKCDVLCRFKAVNAEAVYSNLYKTLKNISGISMNATFIAMLLSTKTNCTQMHWEKTPAQPPPLSFSTIRFQHFYSPLFSFSTYFSTTSPFSSLLPAFSTSS